MAVKKKLKPIDDQTQLILIPGGLSTKRGITDLEAKVAEPSKKVPLNLMPSYGVLSKSMGVFGSTPTPADLTEAYLFLQQAFYGLHNMESLNGQYGVSHEILIRGHPAVDLYSLA